MLGQPRLHNAGMDARSVEVARAIAALDLVGHVNVGHLRLAVGHSRVIVASLEVVVVGIIDAVNVVGRGSETDDAGREVRGGGREESGLQELVEEEMREVVRAKLEFVAIGCELEVGDSHDASIVHEEVDLGRLGENYSGGGADGRERGLVHLDNLHPGRFKDTGEGGLGLGDVSGREKEGGASRGQGPSGFDADARRRTGDDNDLSLELAFNALVVDDLQGRRARVARAVWLSVRFSVARHDCVGEGF